MKHRVVKKEVRRRNSEIRSKSKEPVIYIAGESPLVEEFAQQCQIHNLRVYTGAKTIPPNTSIGIELTNIDISLKKKHLQLLDRKLKKTSLLLSSSVSVTVTEQAGWIQHPQRLVGISALPTLLSQSTTLSGHRPVGKLIEFAAAPSTTKESLMQAQDFFIQLGKEVSVVQDRVGMVLPRILCMIVNEAYFALQEGIASPQDVDLAMKLGTNYPQGPIEWGEKIGLRQVLAVLNALHNDLQEDRYRTAPLLRQVASAENS